MFNNTPKIYGHVSVTEKGNFVTPEVILNYSNNELKLFNRYCPHRLYPLANVGEVLKQTIVCKFHGFEWSKNGAPLNNNKPMTSCGTATVGKSGLIFKNFKEPDHQWVNDLSGETNLKYSHSTQGSSKGSWLWMMDIQNDLLHIRRGKDVVHPGLSEITDLDSVELDEGDNWALQTHPTGWWLILYPYTFIEWTPGCLYINSITPNSKDTEFGFTWISQYYFDPLIDQTTRHDFEQFTEDVFIEDVNTIEQQKGKYFPLVVSHNRLEDHCVYFGKWVKSNRKE